jgi:short subunit dehydrogenase-like uncharacterized protein
LSGSYLVYGANGYTGTLVARGAAARGHRAVLAGRDATRVERLALELGLPHRIFGLDDSDAVAAGLEGVAAVVHCAGPFARTFRAMAEACLRTRVHYLDITGEIPVFEALAGRDAAARAAGVMLQPGAGFDVVPSDCLALHLKRRLPSAVRLALAFRGAGWPSRGTATTMVAGLRRGGMIRRNGRLTRVPLGWRTRKIDFGRGPRTAVSVPWGDVSTAFHTTGIPDIEVYMAASASLRVLLRAARLAGPLLGAPPLQRLLVHVLRPRPHGAEPPATRSHLWGEVTDAAGRRAVSRLSTPEGYLLTALTVLALVERVLAGDATPGFQTPARAYGPDFVLGIEGVSRSDEELR